MNNNDFFFDKFDHDFDKTVKRTFGAALAIWVVGCLVSLALSIAVIWAIVVLVLHFT